MKIIDEIDENAYVPKYNNDADACESCGLFHLLMKINVHSKKLCPNCIIKTLKSLSGPILFKNQRCVIVPIEE